LDNPETLLIHLGGLGDVCLSESTFLSLQEHFDDRLVGLGNTRFLKLFGKYFQRVERVESRQWLHLFSEKLMGPRWRRIIFIGKDREGRLRDRWQSFSKEAILFIDMYPDEAFAPAGPESINKREISAQGTHVEDYQLTQLRKYGIEPLKKQPARNRSPRIILYPEVGFTKEKWLPENFVVLLHTLRARGLDVILLESPGLHVDADNKIELEDLADVKEFFREGGLFVSNDSGMAHLAGASGLFTITIFSGFEPGIWHPRGTNLSLKQGADPTDVDVIERKIIERMG